MEMFKTNNQLSKEASSLYAEHRGIASSIAANEAYIDGAEKTKASMSDAKSIDLDTYYDRMDLDIGLVRHDIGQLTLAMAGNLSAAKTHLEKNPKLVDIAAKEARKDGVTINLD